MEDGGGLSLFFTERQLGVPVGKFDEPGVFSGLGNDRPRSTSFS